MSGIKYFLVRERNGPVQRSIIPSQAVADHRGHATVRVIFQFNTYTPFASHGNCLDTTTRESSLDGQKPGRLALNSTQPARPVGDGDGQPARQTAQDTGRPRTS